MPTTYNHDHENEITLFGETNFRNQKRRFGIKTDDRRRHMYIIGKTGMGKTTLMENMILSDIYAGHGCCYIDPHGDTAEKLVDFIPAHRINDVVYYNPADTAFPIGFNILETDNEDQKPLVAAGLMGVFKKIWPDVWSARMEYILQNCVLALLDYPGATLLGINRLLVDKEYRARVIAKIRDPIVKTFWIAEFAAWSEKYATEAIAPVQNKVGQFLSSSVIRNIVAQVKSTIDPRRIMDDEKILIVNLSKGRIGEDNMRLLGGMLITKIQLAAQERQNIPEIDRRDFYLFVDEFQNFANESFAAILSEARKYRLNLIVAHQYIEQLDEKVAPAIFGNVGTIITMRVGGADAEAMETEFTPSITPEDLVNLAKFQMYLKLMVDGVATPPFSANTLRPIAKRTHNTEKVIAVSRERYAEPRELIEEKVLKWSGMELAGPLPQTEGAEAAAAAVAASLETPSSTQAAPSLSLAPVHAPAPAYLSAIQYPAIKTEEERAAEEEGAVEYLKINPERLAAIQASIPAQSKPKPKFPHTCTRCGKSFSLPIQLDVTRPIYCAECRPLVLEERKNKSVGVRKIMRTPLPPEDAPDLPAEIGEAGFAGKVQAANRPRLVREDGQPLPPRGTIKITKQEGSAPGLLEELLQQKKELGVPVELRKNELVRRAGEPAGDGDRKKRRRRKKRGPESGIRSENPVSTPTPHSAVPTPPSSAPPSQPLAPGQRIRFDS